jgi:hypothetical protein
MVRPPALFFLCGFLALLSTHCDTGDNDDDDDDDDDVGTRRAFITEYCQLVRPCCEASGYSGGSCENQLGISLPLNLDPASGRACLDAIRAASGGVHFCSKGLLLRDVTACERIERRGNVPVGGECRDTIAGVDCAPSAEGPVACVAGGGGVLCQLQSLGAEGDACVADSHDDGTLPGGAVTSEPATEPGKYCDRSKGLWCDNFDHRCVKRLSAETDFCTLSESCAEGTYCKFGGARCVPLSTDGAACESETECLSGHCNQETKQCDGKGREPFLRQLCGA